MHLDSEQVDPVLLRGLELLAAGLENMHFVDGAAAEDAEALVDEAEVEHASAKDLIAQIQEMDPDDDLYDAKVKVLGEQIEHHVKEEEKLMFPKAKKAGLDLVALADEMLGRKEEISATL